MLDAHIDALFDVSVTDSLVDYDADSGFGYVVDDSGFAMVDFVGHAFLDGAVGFHVDDVSDSGEWSALSPIMRIGRSGNRSGERTCIDVDMSTA